MKTIIIRNAKIVDKNSDFHNSINDVMIEDGIIKQISSEISINQPFYEVEIDNLHISPGWIDLHVRFGEPGFENRETITSGLNEAAKSGFTGVVLMPSTNPPIDTKSGIEFFNKKSFSNVVDLYPTGCISKYHKQTEISEMYDMFQSGAVAFTDDKKTIQNSMLLNIALEYVKSFNGLIMTNCVDPHMSYEGQVDENINSVKMGINTIPEVSEDIIVDRDISLLKYTNSRLHLSTISSYNALKKIKKAKSENLNLTVDVAAYNLILNTNLIKDFDTNVKLLPPLRTEETRLFLIDSIIDGTIDAVSSDHTPLEFEDKNCEFNLAKFGMIGLKTLFPILNKVLGKKIELHQIIKLISQNPRRILNLPENSIKIGKKANLTLFDPQKKWKYEERDICSLSKNTPFIGSNFEGISLGVYNNSKLFLND